MLIVDRDPRYNPNTEVFYVGGRAVRGLSAAAVGTGIYAGATDPTAGAPVERTEAEKREFRRGLAWGAGGVGALWAAAIVYYMWSAR